jgi:2-keto-4-pentenoate hydratase/2-oxohepta-3-ene-1,7-dioic acid hydratase in catechol pathway
MRIVTFIANRPGTESTKPRVGALLGSEYVFDFHTAVSRHVDIAGERLEYPSTYMSWFDMDGRLFQQARELYQELEGTDQNLGAASLENALIPRSQARLLAPVPRPGKLICIGLNYRDHAAESNMKIPEQPVVFSKFTTSVIAPGEPVVLPTTSHQVDYEAELAVVIGRRAKGVKASNALDYVLGYTIVNDVSARDFQFADGQWQRGKSCDTFCPMGPAIVTTDDVPDPHKLSIKLQLNDQTMQDSNTDQLIFGVPQLIEFLSETITLEPGDVIATGTPAGVGFARKPPVFLKPGDVMQVEIEKLCALRSPVIAVGETSEAASTNL